MTPDQAIREARTAELRPVYLVLGEERQLASDALVALREAALAGGVPGLNDDSLTAGEAKIDAVLATARTLPMLARRRLVVVRSVERWEGRSEPGSESASNVLDQLAAYIEAPVPSTVLVLIASKLDGRRKLVTAAKKAGCLVACEPLKPNDLPPWIAARARESGVRLAPGVAQLVAELAGPDLAPVKDALERVSLFVGPDREITEDDVGECLIRVRPGRVWDLVDAIADRDLGKALAAFDGVWDPQGKEGLPLVGSLARTARQLIKFEAARRDGATTDAAAQIAGAPPWKGRDLQRQVSRFARAELEGMLEIWSEVDLALKGGSRRPPRDVLEHAVIALCRPRA